MESRRETCGSVHRTRDREDGEETAESMADENGGRESMGRQKGYRRRWKKEEEEGTMEILQGWKWLRRPFSDIESKRNAPCREREKERELREQGVCLFI